jgi:hypothetical protein
MGDSVNIAARLECAPGISQAYARLTAFSANAFFKKN